MIQKPKGTYDLYGKAAKKRQRLEEIIRSLTEKYNYTFINTPMFERSELFHRSVGESSDIVRKETYDFKDKADRNMTLKPEGTAGVVRSFIENKMHIDNNLSKFYYFSPCFRYERPQAGRFREHTQFGVEVFGSNNPNMDVEVISLAVSFYKIIGIKDVTVKLNTLGDETSRENYKEALKEYFKPHLGELCEDCQDRYNKNPLRILDCKVDADKEVLKKAPKNFDYLNEESKLFFEKVKKGLDLLSIDYVIDSSLVRGFDYYTHTIFEFRYNKLLKEGSCHQGIIGGGGRYNTLVESLDGPNMPALGFGLGLERILNVLEEENLDLDETSELDVFLYAFDNLSDKQLELTYNLRMHGFSVDTMYDTKNIKTAFKEADKRNSKYILILGEEELKENKVIIKNNKLKEQEVIDLNDLISYLDKNL